MQASPRAPACVCLFIFYYFFVSCRLRKYELLTLIKKGRRLSNRSASTSTHTHTHLIRLKKKKWKRRKIHSVLFRKAQDKQRVWQKADVMKFRQQIYYLERKTLHPNIFTRSLAHARARARSCSVTCGAFLPLPACVARIKPCLLKISVFIIYQIPIIILVY